MPAGIEVRPRRGLAGLLALVLGLGLLAATPSLVSPESADAAVPSPGADEAIVQLYVGDARADDYVIGPLENAIFGLFGASQSASIRDDTDGYVYVPDLADGALLFQCRSDADGDCVFTVPIRSGEITACQAEPTDPRAGPVACDPGTAPGVPQGTRLWVAPLTYAEEPQTDGWDYYANPWWQTAPLANTNHVSIRHTFETPALVGGRSYLAGRDWITSPGITTDPATPSAPASGFTEFTRRVASGGVWPLSRYNPTFVEQCGLNVGMVVDLSSSIGASGAQGQLVDVMDAFVDALRGTPSSVALLTFGTDSPANGFSPNTGLQSVATTADAAALKNRYASWRTQPSWPTNYTNWDRGLAAAAAMNGATGSDSHLDLVLFITDGNPTVYGPNPLNTFGQLRDPSSGYTRFREIGNGLASANLLKS